MKINITVH